MVDEEVVVTVVVFCIRQTETYVRNVFTYMRTFTRQLFV